MQNRPLTANNFGAYRTDNLLAVGGNFTYSNKGIRQISKDAILTAA